jgi:arylsulfatase A-like enzyme
MLLLTLSACSSWFVEPPPPNVALIVLDTVRADRTSLCGNDRPTTPFLVATAARGSHTCAMKTPATWTVPSHASFFTGEPLLVHEASMGHDKTEVRFGVRKMREDLPTLAGLYNAKGYQTALISANGLVSEETGLARDFGFVDSEREDQRGAAFVGRVERGLATLDAERPRFVVVNLIDAHDPWAAIPKGHPFLPQRASMKPTRLRQRGPEVFGRAPYRAIYRDLYDFALTRADDTLRGVMEALEESGFFEGRWRLVITSDHGEFLGEHRRLLHNGPDLYEPVVNVPLVYLDSEGRRPALPSPAGGLGVFDLVQTGSWPADVSIEAAHLSAGAHATEAEKPCEDVSFGTWDRDGAKLDCSRGRVRRFDLRADPEEERPRPVEVETVPGLDDTIHALRTLNATDAPGQTAEEELRALGYISDDQ